MCHRVATEISVINARCYGVPSNGAVVIYRKINTHAAKILLKLGESSIQDRCVLMSDIDVKPVEWGGG